MRPRPLSFVSRLLSRLRSPVARRRSSVLRPPSFVFRPPSILRSPPTPRRLSFILHPSYFILLLAACAAPPPLPPPTPALIRLLATDLTEPLAYDLALAYADVNPNVLVNPALDTPGRLAAELRAGRADLALTITPDPALFGTPVGNLPLHLVVHPDNPIASLTVAQAQDIFAGRLTQWSDVSAEQGDIYLAAREAGSPADDFFRAQLWGDPPPAAVTPSARLAPTWGAMRELIGGNTGGLGYLIGPELADFVRPMPMLTAEGQPAEFSALIVAVAPADPAGPARDFLAWVQSPAGQAILAVRHAPLDP